MNNYNQEQKELNQAFTQTNFNELNTQIENQKIEEQLNSMEPITQENTQISPQKPNTINEMADPNQRPTLVLELSEIQEALKNCNFGVQEKTQNQFNSKIQEPVLSKNLTPEQLEIISIQKSLNDAFKN